MLRMRIQQMLKAVNGKLVRWLAKYFKLVPTAFDSEFVELFYKGEIILYTWPWRRSKDSPGPWISLTFESFYPTLAALDEEWDRYIRYEASVAMPNFRKDID